MRIDVGDTKPHSGVMVLFVHDKGPSEKDDFVVLAEALQKKNRGRGIYAPIPTNGETLNTLDENVKLLMRVRTNITEQRGMLGELRTHIVEDVITGNVYARGYIQAA